MPPAPGPRSRSAAVAALVVALLLAGLLGVLHVYLTRPFWYDEIWRAHFVSEPARSMWSELTVANTPSAFGWLGLTRLCGEVFGWHSWSLRLPGFVALPLLGAAMVLLARRFAGTAAAVIAVLWLCLNSTLLDLTTQLKPYAMETAAAVAILLLWMAGPADTATGAADGPTAAHDGLGRSRLGRSRPDHPRLDRGRLVRRTLAGLLALLAVPGIFMVVPLVAVELWRGPARRWRLVECLPALILTAADTVAFIAHQSSQRNGDYWDRQFLAGRGPWSALRFVADQVRETVTGSVPGIDRFDPSLLHGAVHGGPFGSVPALFVAVAVAGAGLVGIVVLARRPDGRLLLAALGGAELMMLAASAARYWPFGPTRTNLFVVPMIVIVVAVGAERVIRRLAVAAGAQWALPGPELAAGDPKAVTLTQTPPGHVDTWSLSDISGSDVAAGDGAETTRDAVVSPPPAPEGGSRGLRARAVVLLPVAGLLAWSTCGALTVAASLSDGTALWDHRDRLRGLDRMVDAAVAARQVARPGDVVAVGGRLARPGWLYAMEASDDRPRDPSALPSGDPAGTPDAEASADPQAAVPAGVVDHPAAATAGTPVPANQRLGAVLPQPTPVRTPPATTGPDRATELARRGSGDAGTPPRVARGDTVFFGGDAPPLVAGLAARAHPPRRLVVFVFDIERAGLAGQLAALPRAGWCAARAWSFPLTGTLTVYDHCPAPSPRPAGSADALR
ncbi:hypothetical protein [Frankia sp. AgKG'84/4]|uniref:hypothetical protein n=1 Tax=Frankia sp. AgKG'84/4 TaxID=573490 RepID=UPI00200CBA5B|nr:hypothetical protein [Frankia sp. AgKG'84/4]MCL9794947.1 hypothetical protein [Frankia sp. AgKG'84/4]